VISSGEYTDVLRTWWLSDLSGALIVAPAILTWAGARPWRLGRRQVIEAAALLAAVVLLAELPSQRDVPYVVFPALIYAALRFGPPGAATAVLVTAALTVWNTAHNAGPFVRASIDDSLLSTQLFLATAALTSLVLAAVTAERARAGSALGESERSTRALAAEQEGLRRIATLVASDVPARALFTHVTEQVGRLLGATSASLVRYDSDTRATIVGGWTERGETDFPVGSVLPLDGETVIVRVRRSGQPERIDYAGAGGALAERLRSLGYSSSVAAPVRVSSRLWGVLVASAHRREDLPDGTEQRLSDFADLVALALANAQAREMLAASRARIVAAGDDARRRLERNLHDGAQQRLVAVALQIRLVTSQLDHRESGAREGLKRAGAELDEALKELRELARGIHPAVLTDRGLGPAVAALAGRSAVPIEVRAIPDDRLPAQVEVAVYYLIAEAITNVTKYAAASSVAVTVSHGDDGTFVEVSDDGVGGADPAAGSGLRGIADRVEALGGRLDVSSPQGGGTRLTARIPRRAQDHSPV
jgi:signal transduction histidine kinase